MLDRKTFVDFPSKIFSEGKMANIPLIVGYVEQILPRLLVLKNLVQSYHQRDAWRR